MSLQTVANTSRREEVFPNFFSSSVQGDLCFKPSYSVQPHSALSLVRKLEKCFPKEFNYETGRLISCLAEFEGGITKKDFLRVFYKDFDTSSIRRQKSLEASLSKLFQRSKKKFESFGVLVNYCIKSNKWVLNTNSLFIKTV